MDTTDITAPEDRSIHHLSPSAGAQAMVSREASEVMAMVTVAQRYPRDVVRARDRSINAFTRVKLAEQAQYQYARGGTDIIGPSIRAAEALAQSWGQLDFGYRVLSERVGEDGIAVSEVQTFCIDFQSMIRRSIVFPVRHVRGTKRGPVKLTDDRDVYELVANMAARRVRACILAVVPGDVVEDAMEQASTTLKAKADTSPEAMNKMCEAFAAFGVTREQIEKRIQRTLDAITPAQVVGLKRVYVSLRDGMSRPSNWFDAAERDTGPSDAMTSVRDALAAAVAKPAAPEPPMFDAAAVLKQIRLAQTMEELEALDASIGEQPSAEDRAMLIEALRHREQQLEQPPGSDVS